MVAELYWHTDGGHLGPDCLTKFSAVLVDAVGMTAAGYQWRDKHAAEQRANKANSEPGQRVRHTDQRRR